jgi:hypothetical protein
VDFVGNNTAESVTGTAKEVAQLEGELVVIQADIQAGTFTPQAAAKAQTKIINRIDSISKSAKVSQKATLTDD